MFSKLHNSTLDSDKLFYFGHEIRFDKDNKTYIDDQIAVW